MKNSIYFLAIIMLMLTISCEDKCTEIRSYLTYTPVYALKEDVLKAEVTSAREISTPERLYFKDNYVFIVESNEGIHVINNSDPSSPNNEYFISIPGNHDVAIQDHYLYADNYTDLLVFDVSDIHDIRQVMRIDSAFEYTGGNYLIAHDDPSSLIIEYSEEVIEETYDFSCSSSRFDNEEVLFTTDAFNGVSSSGSGVGGSTARFTINNGYLFAVDNTSIRPFDLLDASTPEVHTPTQIGWNIETVFPYENQLFIGSQTGMHIYDVSNPSTPEFLSVFEHANACDPVVVQNDIAFVTLRDGTECTNFINQLDVLDVSDLSNPTLIKTYEMDNPHGLGVRDDCLYICEGDYGLKQFNIEDLNDIKLVNHFTSIHSLDVIPLENNLMLIGNDGFYQYSGLCQDDIIHLSTIAF